MLLKSLEVDDRLASTDNLINRLRHSQVSSLRKVIDVTPVVDESDLAKHKLSERELAVIERVLEEDSDSVPAQKATEPNLNDLIPDAVDKIKISLAQNTAIDLVQDSLNQLRLRIEEVDKPEKLGRIAADASKVYTNLRPKEDNAPVRGSVIIYKPVVADISNYQIIKAAE